MYLSVKDVKGLDGYKLLLTFENGEVGFDSVEWENEADIDRETLYEDSGPYEY